MLGQAGPVLLVEMREDLGVAAAAQHVPARLQARAQVIVVVDLAVLGAPDAAALVREGLVAARDVDDREPASAERAALAGDEAGVVRSAIVDQLRHGAKDVLRKGWKIGAVEPEGACNAAHGGQGRRPLALGA